jgi:hypothetical protein
MKKVMAILQLDLDRAGAVGDGLLLGIFGGLIVLGLPATADLLGFAWRQAIAVLGTG